MDCYHCLLNANLTLTFQKTGNILSTGNASTVISVNMFIISPCSVLAKMNFSDLSSSIFDGWSPAWVHWELLLVFWAADGGVKRTRRDTDAPHPGRGLKRRQQTCSLTVNRCDLKTQRNVVISHAFKPSVLTSRSSLRVELWPQRSGRRPESAGGWSSSWSPLTVRLQSRSVTDPECADRLWLCLMRDLHLLCSFRVNGEHNYISSQFTSWRWFFN